SDQSPIATNWVAQPTVKRRLTASPRVLKTFNLKSHLCVCTAWLITDSFCEVNAMLKINANGTLGFLILVGVCLISALDRGQTQIGFFEWHAVAVVLGGVAGSLLIALRGNNFVKML